jgi:hypothetical protein
MYSEDAPLALAAIDNADGEHVSVSVPMTPLR